MASKMNASACTCVWDTASKNGRYTRYCTSGQRRSASGAAAQRPPFPPKAQWMAARRTLLAVVAACPHRAAGGLAGRRLVVDGAERFAGPHHHPGPALFAGRHATAGAGCARQPARRWQHRPTAMEQPVAERAGGPGHHRLEPGQDSGPRAAPGAHSYRQAHHHAFGHRQAQGADQASGAVTAAAACAGGAFYGGRNRLGRAAARHRYAVAGPLPLRH